MCGIAGMLALRDAAAIDRGTLMSMITALRHRGPDGFGVLVGDGIGLAHARLSIIDLTTGDQPMGNEDGTIQTVFNGEIFNYVELRAELERCGHRFRTTSDTETIVHAYEEYGGECVSRLNGQFAIALWDGPRRRLVLARDRTGIRPLFFTEDRGRLVFASEIKALGPALGAPLALDPDGLAQVFTFWSTIGMQTVFRGVFSLPAGHYLVATRAGWQTARYWQWRPAEPARVRSLEEAADQLRALLVDAVRLQLRADVPVGAYLSGGLDSSAIVSLAKSFTTTPMRTFSIAFEDDEYDESEHQQTMVRYLGTEHSTIRCRRRDIGEQFPAVVYHAETPILRTAPVPLMLLSELVRSMGYKVVLTGEGADEVFAGYDIFKEAKIRRFWARQPKSRFRGLLLRRLYPYLRTSPVSSRAFAESFFGLGLDAADAPFFAHEPRWSTTRRILNLLSPEWREQVTRADPVAGLRRLLPDDFAGWAPLARDQYVEAQTLLTGYLLASQGDRMAMANSVEGRFPFLDHRVIEFANALPPKFKLRGLTEKAVLRRSLVGLLPQEVIGRTKQPYRAPDSQSFFFDGGPLEFVAELLSPASLKRVGIFEPAAVARLVGKCQSGRVVGFADNMAFVGVLSTMLLDELMVHGSSRFPAGIGARVSTQG